MRRIVVCTPTRDTIQAKTVYDLAEMLRYDPSIIFAVGLGTQLCAQRTRLVLEAGAADATHILWIDSDMRFPADTPERLIGRDLAIVGANCRHRQAGEDGYHHWTAGRSSVKKRGVQEVDRIGLGVTLVAVEVFEKVPLPWFALPYEDHGYVGEDVSFCRAARECGFSIWVDHDLSQEVRHIGTAEF